MSSPQSFAFEIPSKTFVIGEYLALQGTASLIMATEPAFFVKTIDDERYNFHPDSPAGRLKANLGMEKVGFSFVDPHQGRGGFGRSTAEYLSVYLYDQMANQEVKNPRELILENLEEFIPNYQDICGGEYRPSGADLVAQVCGGLCWYDGMNFMAETLDWPFPGYDLFVFHTGKKLATHEHLKDLKEINLRPLIPILVAARTSLDQANLKVFAESLNYYYDSLNEAGLSDSRVYESVQRLRENEEVLAAKGCGAMGVDTVIVLAEGSNADKVKDLCQKEDFQFISSLLKKHSGADARRTQ